MSFRSTMDSAIHATSARHVLLTAIGVTALSLVAVNVRADVAPPQEAVSLAGLNLAKDSDAKTAYERLRSASRSVCKQLEMRDPRGMQKLQQCYEAALSNAVASVNNANLARVHNADRSIRIAQRDSVMSSGS